MRENDFSIFLIYLFSKTDGSILKNIDNHIQTNKCHYQSFIYAFFIKVFFSGVTGIYQWERGQWAGYYTSPQNFRITFSFVALTVLVNFDWLVNLVRCSNVSTTNFDLKKRQFCVTSFGMYINLSAIVLTLQIPRYISKVKKCMSVLRFHNNRYSIFYEVLYGLGRFYAIFRMSKI